MGGTWQCQLGDLRSGGRHVGVRHRKAYMFSTHRHNNREHQDHGVVLPQHETEHGSIGAKIELTIVTQTFSFLRDRTLFTLYCKAT